MAGTAFFFILGGLDVAVNVILGIPFITAMKMILDFVDNLATCHANDHPPFPIDFRKTSNVVPAPSAPVHLSAALADTVLELENYAHWRTAQLALAQPFADKRVHFGPDTNPDAFAASPSPLKPDALSISTMSESQNLRHHSVQWMEGFM